MTVKQAIAWLQAIEKTHGPTVLVYFDCPDCKKAFSPGELVSDAVMVRPNL